MTILRKKFSPPGRPTVSAFALALEVRPVTDREARVTLSHMAQVWLRLADRNQDVGKIRPPFQQQQQIQPKNDKE